MEKTLSKIRKALKYWWIGVLLGILFILLGIWVLQSPIESFITFTIYFAITYIISGLGAITFALSNRNSLEGWGWQLSGGILQLFLGFALLANPGVSMSVLVFFVGFWLMFNAISTISMSIEFKKSGDKGWFWILVSGILTTVLAFLVLVNPLYAVSFLSVFIGLSVIFLGIAQIMISWKMRSIGKDFEAVSA